MMETGEALVVDVRVSLLGGAVLAGSGVVAADVIIWWCMAGYYSAGLSVDD
jgi:hypothetical protein